MGDKYNSRFDDEPRFDAEGRPVVIDAPTDGDLEIFQLLNRYRFLPINYIAAYTGRSKAYLNLRLDLLARKPNKWLNRPEQFRGQPKELSRFLDYEIAPRAKQYLKGKKRFSSEPRFGDNILYAHSRMINEAIINLEMGVRLSGNTMIWWLEIAKRLNNPHRFIPVKIQHQFQKHHEQLDFEYSNDSNGPFGVRYGDGTARFFSLEAEHTNRVDTEKGLKQTSFLKKFLAIQYLMQNKLYKEAWGIPSLIHLVVAPNEARIETMKALIMRETKGQGASYIAFAVAPVIEDADAKLIPDPELFTRPWQRAGFPDLMLSEPTKGVRHGEETRPAA
jgi:hypothetical protein